MLSRKCSSTSCLNPKAGVRLMGLLRESPAGEARAEEVYMAVCPCFI